MMTNLSNRDRSRIRWERYRSYIVWCIEWQDYDGVWRGDYGVTIDGEWAYDCDRQHLYYLIDLYWIDIVDMTA